MIRALIVLLIAVTCIMGGIMENRSAYAGEHHDLMVEHMAKSMVAENFDVFADLKGWPQPGLMRGHIPDVTGHRNNETVVVEIETADSISWSKTADQWRAFATPVGLRTGPFTFIIGVSAGAALAARKRCDELGIRNARVIEVDATLQEGGHGW